MYRLSKHYVDIAIDLIAGKNRAVRGNLEQRYSYMPRHMFVLTTGECNKMLIMND